MKFDEIQIGQTVRVTSREGWVATVEEKFHGADGTEYVKLRSADKRWAFNWPHQLELMDATCAPTN